MIFPLLRVYLEPWCFWKWTSCGKYRGYFWTFLENQKWSKMYAILETKATNREKDAGKASEAPFACPPRLPNKPRRSKRLALPALELRCGVSSERLPIGSDGFTRWKWGKGANKQKTSRLSIDNIHYIIFISHNPPIIPPFLSHGSMSKPWYP